MASGLAFQLGLSHGTLFEFTHVLHAVGLLLYIAQGRLLAIVLTGPFSTKMVESPEFFHNSSGIFHKRATSRQA